MDSFVFTDKKGNHYLYSYSKSRLVYINEILFCVISEYIAKKDIGRVQELIKGFSEEQSSRSLARFYFLRDNGYFDEKKIDFCRHLEPEYLNDSIVDINDIVFELTQKCNLTCTYCVYGDLYRHEGNNHLDDLNLDVALCIIDTLCDQMKLRINTSIRKKITLGFYGGEPLLKFDLIMKIVEYAESKSCDDFYFEYSLTTNGLLLEKYIDYFVKYKFNLLVSLDGNFENSSYRVTKNRENIYNTIIAVLLQVKNRYPDYFTERISFNSVLHDKNSVEEVALYFQEMFNKVPMFSELSSSRIRNDKQELFKSIYRANSPNYRKLRESLSEHNYIALNKGLKNVPVFFYELLNINIKSWTDWLCDYEYQYYPSATCLPFSNRIFVSADGRLHLCEHIGYNYSIGYIDLKKKCIIFDRNQWAMQYTNYFSRINSSCNKCAEFFLCKKCLFERNMKCAPITCDDFIDKIISNMDILRERETIINYE